MIFCINQPSNPTNSAQLGVTNVAVREKILNELAAIRERGPEETKEEKRSGHRALFDIVRQSAYDQVLAVETPLTTRDIIVTHGRLGCLQITKVNGVNLPLRENDCLLEINDCPGEQFKSALMLTKLISDSNGSPIRFVVLRMKTVERADDTFAMSSPVLDDLAKHLPDAYTALVLTEIDPCECTTPIQQSI
ncbi:unnamed protein product [Nippostrongylus brasiliensis]|uniref:Uncharacterized protein n=1 Tax=Nippostrongylus brasiliensis TaxID=27835 RepID=A0A3P7BU38_NIPBR|nr:unnamed protein product [Nippostrongylus brasiliensis]